MPRWSQQWRVGMTTEVVTAVSVLLTVVVLSRAPQSETSAAPGSEHAGVEGVATTVPAIPTRVPGEPSRGMPYDTPSTPPNIDREAALLKAGTHPFGSPYEGTTKPSAR